jgi:ABC-type molybdate transport system substrate-binding protein
MRIQSLKVLVMLMIASLLLGCAGKNIRVRCDEHLQPINVAAAGSSAHASTPTESARSGSEGATP